MQSCIIRQDINALGFVWFWPPKPTKCTEWPKKVSHYQVLSLNHTKNRH